MKRSKKNIFSKAGVLFVAVAMVISILPAVTADTLSAPDEGILPNPFASAQPEKTYLDVMQPNTAKLTFERMLYDTQGSFAGGLGATDFIGYCSPADPLENALGLTGGGEMIWGIRLGSSMLTTYDTWVLDTVRLGHYGYTGDYYDGYVDILDGSLALLGTQTYSHTMVADGAVDQVDIVLSSPVTIDASDDLYIILHTNHIDGTYPGAGAAGPTIAGYSDIIDLGSGFESIGNYGFYVDWMIQAGVSPGGTPSGECLEDQCDFEIVALNQAYMYEGRINELPQIINITVTNNGELGINEIKLLADVFKKVCGPTSTLYCDEKYDLRFWETETADVFSQVDDGDGDTWVLQGGAENRWATNNQAWRCTPGEDRSYGGDVDTYLGLCDTCSGADELIFNPIDPEANEISGAACATLTFQHWCEGEYTFDDNGYVVPVDYGFVSYRIDDGSGTVAWTDLSISDFVAYDTDGEWEDVTIKFLNENVFASTSYAAVCDDCEPAEGDIVVLEAFPVDAFLEVKFSWIKDPCYQFEGWYVDNLCITRTEMYDLELVHQAHEIIALDGCDWGTGPVNTYVDFELGWDPEPDTWYQIDICGQVFSPNDCEFITENNCISLQFYVTDIHDVMCKSMDVITAPPYVPGDSITVNMTVQNIGSFAEDDIPVVLKVADCVVDKAISDDFETDPSGRWTCYYFGGFSPECLWGWTDGDPSIDDIWDVDEISARSVLPGSESFICANPGSAYNYPYLTEGIGCMITDDVAYDFMGDGAMSADLTFYAKWSLEIEQVYDSWYGTWSIIPGSEGAKACMLVHPTAGPDSAYWWIVDFGAWNHNGVYHNDWIQVGADMLGMQDSFSWTVGTETFYPPIEFGWGLFSYLDDGDCGNPTNPVPWSGFMLDRIELDIVTCGGTETIVDEKTVPGTLAPGDEATVQLTWDSAEFCSHCLIADVNLATDMDTSNDICSDCVLVSDTTDIGDFTSMDLTGGGDCLWHLCDSRGGGDDTYAWAGVEEPTWAHYIDDMDDSFISPQINISACGEAPYFGAALNFTTWYEFYDASDFGEIYIRGASSDPWTKVGGVSGTSGGVFIPMSIYLEPAFCTATFQVYFRMVSDGSDVSEGWFIDDVELVRVTSLGSFAAGDILFHQPVHGTGDSWSFANVDEGLGYGMYENFQLSADAPIGEVSIVGLPMVYSGGWVPYPPNDAVFHIQFYDDAYGAAGEPSALLADFTIDNSATDWTFTYVDSYSGYDAYEWTFKLPSSVAVSGQQGWMFAGGQFLFGSATGGDSYSYHKGAAPPETTYDRAMTLIEGGPSTIEYGAVHWSDDFERENIAPWQCLKTHAGDFWEHYTSDTGYLPSGLTEDYNGDDDWWVVHGYPSTGKGLNDIIYTELDFTDELITNAQLHFAMAWLIEGGCEAFIEISEDYDEGDPMHDATWIPFWHLLGDGTASGGWLAIDDIVNDGRFVLNQYLGQKIYLRFRYTTPGEGSFGVAPGHGWAIDGLSLEFKADTFTDTEPPVTSIFFNPDTAKVTLIAEDMPINKGSGVKATYYKIDGGSETTYTGAFSIGEGTHTVQYWSVDNVDNEEASKTASFTVDSTAPTVELTSPEEGKLYLFGSPIMSRIIGDGTLCIGKVPVAANADDGTGSGVSMVMFSFSNGDSGYDDDGSNGFTYLFKGMQFGALTITAVAIDNAGLTSTPDSMEVTVYSLGLM